jgi:Polyketide cyclase / dehydrase and lipid transport
MGRVDLVRTMAGPPERAFSVVGDLPAYGRFLPLTRVEHDPGLVGVGWRFTGRSGIGPLVLVDRMRVTEWDPPYGFAVEKLGPVLTGGARATLWPDGSGTRVVWQEEITVRPTVLGRHLRRLTDPVTRWLFGRALDRMAARVARG